MSSPSVHGPSGHHHSPHAHAAGHHGDVVLDEEHWRRWAEQAELEGEVYLAFVSDGATWAAELRREAIGEGRPVRRVLDLGSGPGVGTCELARLFPDADIVAVDGSATMLAAVTRRAQQEGLGSRISAREVELPGGLEDLGSADVIWMSLALHHVGDEVGLLRALRAHLAPGGVLAIAELGDPLRVWQADVEISGAERAARIERARAAWFARMRAGLAGSVPSEDLAVMVRAAGLEVAGDRLVRLDLTAPLPEPTRRAALGHLRQIAAQLRDDLDEEDRAALERLGDDEHASVLHRPDVWLQASRRIVIARAGDGQER